MTDSEKPDDSQQPELVVDTDWKEQVAREKEQAAEAARQQQASGQSETADSSASEQAAAEAAGDDAPAKSSSPDQSAGDEQEMPPPPPASFEVLVSMMFTQAMAMLGQMPDPATGKATVNKPYAKHYIDTLEMLEAKTQGNLSDNESKVISEALHALRMMYVSAKQ